MHKYTMKHAGAILLAAVAAAAWAQEALLPNAPGAQPMLLAASHPAAAAQNTSGGAQAPGEQQQLTLAEAEQIALRNNPHISVARLLALAQAQTVRAVRANYMPFAAGNLTAVDAHDGTRVTAGALNNPVIYDRAAGGLTVSQLITDFGRTHNLVLSAQSVARAQLENERATEQDIKLTVEQAFYQALTAQALLRVAQETVDERQATVDEVSALAKSKLRSELDLSFANVQLSQAKLLLLDAKNHVADAMAELNTVLGSDRYVEYTLVDETVNTPAPAPQDAEPLVQAAFSARPDLAALNDSYIAARQYSKAERDLWMPTVSALATVGGTPVRADQITSPWYGAAGGNINIPLFNGFLYNARAQEAKLRANATQEQVRNLRDDIARDVRTTVLNAQAAFQRIGVTQEMLNQSKMALDLAQARYQIGLSGIVELSQAQLSQTQAEIAYTNARYAYQTALAEVRFQLGQ